MYLLGFFFVYLFFGIASCTAISNAEAISLLKRTLPNSPKEYTPSFIQCPSSTPSIRDPTQLSDNETQWLEKRRANTVQPLKDFLGRVGFNGFDVESYINQGANNISQLPNVAIAFSGGGYRAMTVGAGMFAAFDNRTPGANQTGHIGGLLQSATYVSGLSGGGWLLGSIYANNFSTVPEMQAAVYQGSNIWALGRSILQGPDSDRTISALGTVDYINTIYDQVQGKRNASFDTSITDYWGRGLSYQWFSDPEGGAAHTFSSISESPGFPDATMPMPILIADARAPGETLIPSGSTVFEFNPWEMGSFDPSLYGFAPLKYVGSTFQSGSVVNTSECVIGFDNAGFVMGTSSSLFNLAVAQVVNAPEGQGLLGSLTDILQGIAEQFGASENDIASWSPNPFYEWNGTPVASSRNLTLVDGGEDGQNIPLYPFLQQQRNVDVVFAVDSSADTLNGAGWPNGTSLIASYQRSLNSSVMNGTAFPAIPDVNTFINLGLNARPTFFGCNSANQTAPTPIIVYISNAAYSYFSNISTYTTQINNTARDSIIQNGYEAATLGNGTIEPEWPLCVGCAILSRSLERTNTPIPQQCVDCFAKHCWNGTRNSTTAFYDPPLGGSAARDPGRIGVTSVNPSTQNAARMNAMASPLLLLSGLSVVMLSFV